MGVETRAKTTGRKIRGQREEEEEEEDSHPRQNAKYPSPLSRTHTEEKKERLRKFYRLVNRGSNVRRKVEDRNYISVGTYGQGGMPFSETKIVVRDLASRCELDDPRRRRRRRNLSTFRSPHFRRKGRGAKRKSVKARVTLHSTARRVQKRED